MTTIRTTIKTQSGMHLGKSVGLLLLRLTFGTLMMGHGSQKLFGWFGGPGIQGTTKWLGSMGMRPPKFWAMLAGLSEFGGGLLMALGFLNPIGPLAAFAAMAMATIKAHLGKPIWASQGGPELPITNMAITSALMAQGPGAFSLDHLFGLRLPRWLLIPGLIGIAAALAYTQFGQHFPKVQAQVQQAMRSATQSAQQIGQAAKQQVSQATSPSSAMNQTANQTASQAANQAANQAGISGQPTTRPSGSR